MVTSETVLAQSQEAPDAPQLVFPSQREMGFWKLLSQLWFKRGLFLGSDVLAISLAHYLAESLTQRWLEVSPVYMNPSRYSIFYVLSFVVVLFFFEGYRDPDSRRPEKELELGFKGISFFFVALACSNFLVFKSPSLSPYLVSSWYGTSILLVLGARFGLRGLYQTLWRHGLARETTLLAGPANRLTDLLRHLAVQKHLRYKVLGVLLESTVTPQDLKRTHCALPILGFLEDWEKVADQLSVRWLILNLSANEFSQSSHAHEIARRCQEKGIAVQVHSGLLSSCHQYERDEFSGCLRFSSPACWSRLLQMAAKAVMDRFIGAIGSVVVVALTPMVALLLRLEDQGPVFYRREFVDRDGVIRHYLKFRTMVEDADQQLKANHVLKKQFEHKYKLEQDPRILRVGRFLRKYSVDEFPQFFSLLTGRLSFVGPRVISGEESSRYGSLLPRLLSVKPGLTGYWQVMGRQKTSYDERIQMDMFYIEHWSIWLDLVIAAKTLWKVPWADGAY